MDPIDGTEEFVKGLPEFAVSVALVQNGLPVMAVIYNPATDELFYAARGQGAYLNGKAINITCPSREKLTILASRSQFRKGKFKAFEPFAEIRPVGSIAYKLALVSAGKANATFSLEPKNEWDIAAGVLLVEESGGTVTDKEGLPFTFNRAQPLVDGIIAASSGAYSQVKLLIVEHAR